MAEVLAIVPCKGTSSRVPGKNLRTLGGKPLVAWTLEAAKGCPQINRTIVSTESHTVEGIAKAWGCEVASHPALDPGIEAPDVALHVLEVVKRTEAYKPDVVVMLLPTSPFRTSEHITGALALHYNCFNVLSCSERRDHVGLRLGPGGILQRDPVHNGAILIAKTDKLLRDGFFSPEGAQPYWMPCDAGLDINTEADFSRAERIAARLQEQAA